MPKLPEPNARSLVNLDKLNKIAAKIGEQLRQRPIEKIIDWESRYSYSCDESGNVTGLNCHDF